MSRRTIAIAAALSVLALGSPLLTGCTNPLATQYFDQRVEKYEVSNYQAAIADYDKAIEINPQLASAFLNRGVARELVNDLDGACRDWSKVVDLGNERPAEWVKNQC